MNTDRRESSITLYVIAEDKRSRSAQWKIIISETLVLTKIGVRILRIMNNSYFLKTQRNSVLHLPCAPIQPKHIFKCFFHLRYKLSNACPRFPRTKVWGHFLWWYYLICLSLVYLVVLICFGKNYGRTYYAISWCKYCMNITTIQLHLTWKTSSSSII